VKLEKSAGFTAKRRDQGGGSGSDLLDQDPAARIDCGRGWRRLTGIDRFDRPANGTGPSIGDPAALMLCTRGPVAGSRRRVAARDGERRHEAAVGLGCTIRRAWAALNRRGRRAGPTQGNRDGGGGAETARTAARRTAHGGGTTASPSRRLGARGRQHAAPAASSLLRGYPKNSDGFP
jgi:hypothetical protein